MENQGHSQKSVDFSLNYGTIKLSHNFWEKGVLLQMKKLVCLAIALCLAVFSFSGCGSKEKDDDNSSLASTVSTTSPTPTPVPQTAKALRVTADSGLNIRSEASTDGEILGLAENGQRLALMMEDAQNGWYQIQYEGKTAYVSAEYAEVIEVTMDEYNQLRGLPRIAAALRQKSRPVPRNLPLRNRLLPPLPPRGPVGMRAALIPWTRRTANNAVLFFLRVLWIGRRAPVYESEGKSK